MRIAIFENIMTPGGHEVDFDRILVDELKNIGHEVMFYVPKDFQFNTNYHVPVRHLPGAPVVYTNASGMRKLFLSVQRECRRFGWYRALYEEARTGAFDVLIVPTSTYRYLRALRHSVLRRSPVPVIFIQHGINPREAPKFFAAADALAKHPQIRPVVLTFGDALFGERRPHVRLMPPPTFVPRDIHVVPRPPVKPDEPITIGFFGQFRREKHLEELLRVYLSGNYTRPVRLLVQGSTMHAEDAVEFERIIAAFAGKGITFLHRGLIGAEWQRAISVVDALLLPYSAPRYRYHWGAMLFTAIGFQKPVLTSDDMNPEVFERFPIGITFQSGDTAALRAALETLINAYDVRAPQWQMALRRAAQEYAPARFAAQIVSVAEEKDSNGALP